MQLPPFEPISALSRGSIPEIVVYGTIVTKYQGQPPKGPADLVFLTRSLLNPWQFLACEVIGRENFWAIGLALHSGQECHMEALEKLAIIADSGDEELICPREYPIDWEVVARLKLSQEKPSRFHHPNSGKHLLMLANCRKFSLPLHSYWEPSHPLQKKIFGIVGREAGEEVRWVTDSCGLPTAVMSMRAHLNMWEKLSLDQSPLVTNLKQLWLENPILIGGKGRLDSEITLASEGSALVKEGADGLIIVQSLPTTNEPIASILIKLAGGYHRTHIAMALLAAIQANPSLPSVFERIESYLKHKLDDWLRPGVEILNHPNVK